MLGIEAITLVQIEEVDEAIADGEVLAGFGDEVDEGVPGSPVRYVGDAPGDDDFHIWAVLLHLHERVKLTVDAVLGPLPDNTRVQHHEVGVVWPVRCLEAIAVHPPVDEPLRVRERRGQILARRNEQFNDRLSLQRAVAIQRRIEAQAPETAGRLVSVGMGFRENLVGSGTDDLRDALDRRVEFKVRNC